MSATCPPTCSRKNGSTWYCRWSPPEMRRTKQRRELASAKGRTSAPGKFGPEDLDDLRSKCLSPDFEMLYQQDFDFQALPAIRAEHFATFTKPMPSSRPVVLSVDAGMGNRRRSAFSVVQAWCVIGERFYLLNQFREQCDFSELRDNVRRFRKIYRPVAILIERAANGYALISDLTRKHGKLVIPIDPDGRSSPRAFASMPKRSFLSGYSCQPMLRGATTSYGRGRRVPEW